MGYKKKQGYKSEAYVSDYVVEQFGYTIVETNFTIRGGEIDIIAIYRDMLICIEVKDVRHTDDMTYTITPAKHRALRRTLAVFCQRFPSYAHYQPVVHVAYVCQGEMISYIDDIWYDG